jgi:rSAM/selenodomain-associated transferase 1
MARRVDRGAAVSFLAGRVLFFVGVRFATVGLALAPIVRVFLVTAFLAGGFFAMGDVWRESLPLSIVVRLPYGWEVRVMRSALVVMARYPRIGEVKTRLAREIGAERTYRLYRAFLQDIDARFAGGRRTLVWAFHPPDADFAALISSGSRCLPQRGESLGARMWNCFRVLCGEGFERVIMIGADVPHVRDEWLDEADAQLGIADVVLGPSDDGGYYLVAMRASHDLFTDVAMSTERVLVDTLGKAAAAGLRVHLLPRGFDVDDGRDLVQLRRTLEREDCRVRLPHTAAVLAAVCSNDP